MKYPIGMQDFEDLRKKGFTYVDKTKEVYDMVSEGKCYFLGRPRRFGKSLLLSTLEAYFLGKKELFKGLAIETLESEWIEYPVLRLDLNTALYDSEVALDSVLNVTLCEWERDWGKEEGEVTPALRFRGVIERACKKTGRQVVVLVDEYDKPLVSTFDNPALQECYRAMLKAFCSVLKTQDRYIRFALLTGVTKFGKVSVFSDLNNLNDISMNRRYACVCGITEREIRECFAESVREMAGANGWSYDQTLVELKRRYDGYHFCPECEGVYNPFSLLKAFSDLSLGSYWFETGTPTFLVQLLKNSDYELNTLQNAEVRAEELGGVDSYERNPIPMIYQSGYLTIKGYDKRFGLYSLGFPNQEVERGFVRHLVPMYTQDQRKVTPFSVERFISDVEKGDAEAFMTRLKAFFEDADYRVAGKMEIYFQNVMFVVFKMMGFYTQVERATSRGRVDVVIQTDGFIYVIECKLDGSVADALAQIEQKGYAAPYEADGRRLFKIGVSFSSESRGIDSWQIVPPSTQAKGDK